MWLADDLMRVPNASVNEATRGLAEGGWLADLGIEPVAETPEEFARFIAAEVTRNGELLRSANFAPM